jgi:hypothetical protein
MGWFNKTRVPNTISDKQMADLSRRAQKAQPSMFDPKTVKQRLNSKAQRNKAQSS